jgi:flavin prenyltransferase
MGSVGIVRQMAQPFRLVVGVSGASGVVYGIRLLEVLAGEPNVETHLVMSPAARQTIQLETDWDPAAVEELATHRYRFGDIAASISSGSFPIDAMAVVPCSMGTLSAIALSASDNLLERAADVTLKERRRLVLAPREAPLHLGHLRLMTQVTEMGAIVCPPSPGFYTRPATLEELIDHTVSRLLDVTGVKLSKSLSERWTGPEERRRGRNGTGRPAARGEAAAETESGVGAEPEGAAESR